jgi:hypothetical protein
MKLEKMMKKRIDHNLDQIVKNPYETKKKKKFPLWAKIMIPVTAVTAAVAIPIIVMHSNNLESIISELSGAYINMEGVTGFGIGNTPDDNGKIAVKNIKYLHLDDSLEGENSSEDTSNTSWSDEERERYDWESDYDWDPDKANVLFTFDEEGEVTEVIYERTNNRGQVRQDHLGNAAAMFVSKNFTYVMYVNDDEWAFWQEIDYAQELRQPSGFHVHHEMMQTIVIHNQTGKVFPLKDLQTKLSEVTGAKQYTMQANPTKDDFVEVDPIYGTFSQTIPRWFKVTYDEELDNVVYTNVLPENSGFNRSHTAKEDIYGQTYVLADDEGYYQEIRLQEDLEIVPLTTYEVIDKTLITRKTNSVFFGSDNRAYAIQDNTLKVFGDNFELKQIEKETKVNFEGLANEFYSTHNDTGWLNGSCFHYEEGYLYSAFGEVWQVNEDGILTKLDNFEGNFARYTNDAFMIGGEIIAFVDTHDYLHYSVDGRIVQLSFSLKDGVPSYEMKHIINSTEYHSYGHRLIALQDERGGLGRGFTKYFLIMVVNGVAQAQYVAYGDNGGMLGVAGTISEPIDLTV